MPGWAWLVLGFVLLAGEMFAPGGFYLLFPGLAAIIVGLLGMSGLGGPDWLQWLLFTVFSIGALTTLRNRLAKGFRSSVVETEDSLIGVKVTVTERIEPWGEGQAEHRGSVWKVENRGDEPLEAGRRYTVDAINGVTLRIGTPPRS